MISTLWQDFAQSLRVLRSKPTFTLVAVVSLALGIGANTAIFSIISTTLLQPIGFENEERLVVLSLVPSRQNPGQRRLVTGWEYQAWKESAQSFEIMGAMYGGAPSRTLGAQADEWPAESVQIFRLEADVFHVLGIRPVLGRLFTSDEDRVDNPAPVALISHRFWQRRFGGDPGALGATLVLDGAPTTVIGVMPEGLSETLYRPDADLWIPWSPTRAEMESGGGFNHIYARLHSGTSVDEAQAEMGAIEPRFSGDVRAAHVESLRDWFVRDLRGTLLMLQSAVALVLLIACANVVVLLLAAASSRQNEVALRNAVGASRGRMMRQLLTESFVLSALGGLLGVFLASNAVRFFAAVAPGILSGSAAPTTGLARLDLEVVAIDGRALAFTGGVILVTVLMFGLIPAWQSARPDLSRMLNAMPRGSTAGAAQQRFRLALVSAQTALALMLLVGAGLLISSFLRLQANPLGADPGGVLTFRLLYPQDEAMVLTDVEDPNIVGALHEVRPEVAATFEQVRERLSSVAGVESVAASMQPPFAGTLGMRVQVEGQTPPAFDTADSAPGGYMAVSPEYFVTMRVPLLRGRDFSHADNDMAPPVAIINETMARQYWPGEDPLDRRFTVQTIPDAPREIIGVVGDMLPHPFAESGEPSFYVPHFQQMDLWPGGAWTARAGLYYLIRTPSDPMTLLPSVRSAVAEVVPGIPMTEIRTLEQQLSAQLGETRLFALLLGTFSVVAMLVAAVGLFGVMTYAVAERRGEIAIRRALGAPGSRILTLVVRQAIAVIAIGLSVGLGGALALTHLLEAALWGVTPTDPITFAAVSLMLLVVALLACLIPIRRALAFDPAVALRNHG